MDFRPLIVGAILVCGCDEPAAEVQVRTASPPLLAPHAEYVIAGPPRTLIDTVANPYAGVASARAAGERLYNQYNCVSCHGGDGAGGIGPTLNDDRWKYGGTPAEIFQTIYEGRPEGMPIWGGRIPDEQIWQLVTYLESLGGADMATVSWPGIPSEASRRTPAR